MAVAMDGYVRQLHSGIDQQDFSGRNVVLAPRGSSADGPAVQSGPIVAGLPLPRVVLIDYNEAVVFSLTEEGRSYHMDRARPFNPMLSFWDEALYDFGGWVPHEWFRHPKLMQQWLQRRFGTEEVREMYDPVDEELVFDGPDYEPPLDLAKHGFRVAVFNPSWETQNDADDSSHAVPARPGSPSGGSGSERESSGQDFDHTPNLAKLGFRISEYNPREH